MPWQVVTAPGPTTSGPTTPGASGLVGSTTVSVGTDPGTIFPATYTSLQAAQENLKTLLSTRIGERIMQPNFGTNLYQIVFEPNISSLKSEISELIRTPISIWLPYIQIRNLDITTNEDDPTLDHVVNIKLSYTIQGFSTNSIIIYVNNDNSIVVIPNPNDYASS